MCAHPPLVRVCRQAVHATIERERTVEMCRRVTMLALAHRTSQHVLPSTRTLLADRLARALRTAGADTASPSAAGTLGECVDVLAEALMAEVHEAGGRGTWEQVGTARQAALLQRLLLVLSVPEADYCPRLGKEATAAFSAEETEAGLQRLVRWGWAVEPKGGGSSTRRFVFSQRYLRQVRAQRA